MSLLFSGLGDLLVIFCMNLIECPLPFSDRFTSGVGGANLFFFLVRNPRTVHVWFVGALGDVSPFSSPLFVVFSFYHLRLLVQRRGSPHPVSSGREMASSRCALIGTGPLWPVHHVQAQSGPFSSKSASLALPVFLSPQESLYAEGNPRSPPSPPFDPPSRAS